jgi:hypothetical protein
MEAIQAVVVRGGLRDQPARQPCPPLRAVTCHASMTDGTRVMQACDGQGTHEARPCSVRCMQGPLWDGDTLHVWCAATAQQGGHGWNAGGAKAKSGPPTVACTVTAAARR